MSPILLAVALFAAEPKKVPVQRHDFENDVIEATTKTPDGSIITYRNSPKFKSLIKVRENFDDKIVRSVDQM
jgi:hypothetical protein